MCILSFQLISVQSRHIPHGQQPHVTSEFCHLGQLTQRRLETMPISSPAFGNKDSCRPNANQRFFPRTTLDRTREGPQSTFPEPCLGSLQYFLFHGQTRK